MTLSPFKTCWGYGGPILILYPPLSTPGLSSAPSVVTYSVPPSAAVVRAVRRDRQCTHYATQECASFLFTSSPYSPRVDQIRELEVNFMNVVIKKLDGINRCLTSLVTRFSAIEEREDARGRRLWTRPIAPSCVLSDQQVGLAVSTRLKWDKHGYPKKH